MLEEKAREVGRLIGQTPEYQAVKRANGSLSGDREATDLLRQVEQLRVEGQQAIALGDQPSEDLESRLEELLSRMQLNPTYQQVIVAQENFDKLMYKVNTWIAEGIRKGVASPIITLS